MADATVTGGPGLLERLAAGPVICAEGYLFEIERRGYLSAGAYVPEAVLEHPETVAQLHRDFLHAGSDVMLAFTYYAHREKLRVIGKEDALEEMNRTRCASRGRRRRGATRWSPATCRTPTFMSRTTPSPPARCAPCSTSRWAGPWTKAWTTSSPRPSPSSARRCSRSKRSRRRARRQ